MGGAALTTAPDRRELDLHVALDLRLTFGSLSRDLRGRHEDGRTWWALRTPEGPASLCLAVCDEGERLVVDGWGPGRVWALARVEGLIGLKDPAEDFRTDHDTLSRLHRRYRGMRIRRTGQVAEALVNTVLGQRVTAEGAMRSQRELTVRFGERAPGPGRIWVGPDLERMASLTYAHLHPCGIERQRASTILRACRKAAWLDACSELPRREAYARLCSLAGIGPWTAPLVMATACGDADAVPVGDYHLPSTIAWHLAGERTATDTRMVALLRPFMGHRWRVIRLLMKLGTRSPRRGPRTEVRDIRGS